MSSGETQVFALPEVIKFYQLCARRGALKLEVLGMRRSNGPTAYALCKSAYGFKGNKLSVLKQMDALVESERARLSEAGYLS